MIQFSSVAQSCPTLCDPMSMPGLPVHHQLPEFTQTHVYWVGDAMMPSSHLILYHPFFLLPSIFPSIRVFSNESVLPIKWPKYWSFSFSIHPSIEYSGSVSFNIDWFDLPMKSTQEVRVFSNESTLRIRWPKYWSFSFSISPSKEHPGLISFRMDWLDLLAVQGTLKSPLQHHGAQLSL